MHLHVIAVALLLVTTASAGEARISLVLDGQVAHAALGLAVRLGAVEQEIDPAELGAGAGVEPVVLALIDATPATVRQAFAHALGRWWTMTPSGAIRYQRAAGLPTGDLTVRTHTTGLVRQPEAEARVRALLTPWLAEPAAGLTYESAEGLWSATLDSDGHARLVEALGVLEGAAAPCPSLVVGSEQPAPDAQMANALIVATWSDLARKLAQTARLSVSCVSGLPALERPLSLPAGRIAELPARLAAVGVRAAILHGVLCIGHDAPVEREHPARRRRVVLLPVLHLVTRPVDGEVLVATIRRHIAPAWWRMPGSGVEWLPERQALLVAADVATIHAVLDLCDRVDLLGLEAALAGLTGAR